METEANTKPVRRMIIPAAGKALRYGGIPKELLPIDMADCCLTRAVKMGRQLGEVVVITNEEKQRLHEHVLRQAGILSEVVLVRQNSVFPELWGAIQLGLHRDTAGGLILADTVTSIVALPEAKAAIMFGTFETKTPERFSVLADGHHGAEFRIRTKERNGANAKGTQAWGLILWEAEVTNFFLDHPHGFDHYDRAFEAAAVAHGAGTFPLSYYFDLGTFPAYLEFLGVTHPIIKR